jgi:hypothetical protein
MKGFLLRVARFGILFLAVGTSVRVSNQWLIRFDRPILPEGIDVLILGDSHIEAAIDPALIPGSRNVAISAEPFMASYYKLSRLLDHNPGVRAVVLGFGPHNLSQFNDEKFLSPPTAPEMFRRYHRLLPWWRMKEVPVSVSAGLAGEARYLWTPNGDLLRGLAFHFFSRPPQRHPYLGGFHPGTEKVRSDSALSAVTTRHFRPTPSGVVYSNLQEQFLRKIVDSVVEKGVTLVLVSTPTHDRYREAIPHFLRHRFLTLWEELVSLPGVSGLDLSDLELTDDDYRDFDHVSESGATRVTVNIAEHLDTE